MTTHRSPLLGIKDAARALKLSHSTVSRYVNQHPELDHGQGGRRLVDLAELTRHRIQNLNVGVNAPDYAGLPLEGGASQAMGPDSSPSDPAATPGVNYNVEKARREAANATLAELELAERLGNVVPRDEVESKGFEVAQALREAMARRNPAIAERLAMMTDPAQIAAYLDEVDRKLLLAFIEHLKTAESEGAGDAAAA